jgi:hypothetical protein
MCYTQIAAAAAVMQGCLYCLIVAIMQGTLCNLRHRLLWHPSSSPTADDLLARDALQLPKQCLLVPTWIPAIAAATYQASRDASLLYCCRLLQDARTTEFKNRTSSSLVLCHCCR